MDQKSKQNAHLPFTGVMSEPYLYIALVCAVKGYGTTLMNLAKYGLPSRMHRNRPCVALKLRCLLLWSMYRFTGL
jgi:hypothetical protein